MAASTLSILLGLFLCQSPVSARQDAGQSMNQGATDSLWKTTDLPESALWRYGASDRETVAVGIHALKFSHDGKWLAARDRRQQMRILNLKDQSLQSIAPSRHVLDFDFSPDDKFIITGDRKGSHLWKVADGKLDRDLMEHPGFRVASDTDLNQLIIFSKGKRTVFSWPLPSSFETWRSKLSGNTILPLGVSLEGRFSVMSNGTKVEIVDHELGSVVPFPQKGVPKKVTLSPDGNLIADVSYGDTQLSVWDRRNTDKYRYLLPHKERVVAAVFSKDNRFLYSSNWKNEITIWDMVTQEPIHVATGHSERIYGLDSSHQLLCLASGASGSTDRSIIYWNFRDQIFPEVEVAEIAINFSIDDIWRPLASDDATISLGATNQLYRHCVLNPSLASQIIEKARVVRQDDNRIVTQLVQELNAPNFQVRENASQKLLERLDEFRPQLQSFWESETCPSETKWRLRDILNTAIDLPRIDTPSGRRDHRLVLALELAGNDQAKAALRLFAQHHANPNIVAIASDAIIRLEKEQPE
jgi:hypothetical protein